VNNRLVVLAGRPRGMPTQNDFRLIDAPVPEPAAGEALVRNTLMSVDPAMRPRMNDVPSYVPPFQVGEPLEGQAIGEVIASKQTALPVGALVRHRFGWRDYALIESGTVVDTARAPASRYLGLLGGKGLTAYAGLVDVAKLRAGEIVYISAAAGAVGSAAGAIAKLLGATTIGSTGSPENVRFLIEELGFDRAFHARDGPLAEELARAAPDGIDVYFDNVGGETLAAALEVLRVHGRIAVCGMIAGYNAPLDAPKNLFKLISKRIRMEGFLVSDHAASAQAFSELIVPALEAGRVRAPETFVDGLENAPAALISLFARGAHRGKLLVRLTPP
jgi:NADPH-dependent curcumin reductase CurA